MLLQEIQNPGFLHRELLRIDPEEASKHHPNSQRFLLRALEIHHHTGQTKTALAQQQPVDWPMLMI
ncbi:MAG: hypothetical protein H6765_00530 [Candidatus Peribacteria bacterium]|nr:MAG: hypothetical protein H6765_00530 [Candidatus Peribacteria bacterium]